MPVTYRVDAERRRILTRCEGETTLREVLAHFDELEHDPRCPPGADVLLDLSSVTSLPNVGQIRSAADRAGGIAGKLRFGAIAIVADSEDLFGVARLFEMFTRQHFARSRVLPTRAEAESWLDAPESSSPRPVRPK